MTRLGQNSVARKRLYNDSWWRLATILRGSHVNVIFELPPRPSFFDVLDSSLLAILPSEAVALTGNWLPATRRAHEPTAYQETGACFDREVIDVRWQGTLTCAAPICVVTFVATDSQVYWVKSPSPASDRLPVDISLHTYADDADGRATLTAAIGGGIGPPGVPVTHQRRQAPGCVITSSPLKTTRVERLVTATGASVYVLILLREWLKTGRKRLWHVRGEIAASLPPEVRDLLLQRRTGTIA